MVWSLQLKVLTAFFLVTNSVVTAGVIYGWASLQRQLVSEGQFASSCGSSPTPCSAQETQLNTVATVAFNLANAGTVVHGFTLDRYGVRPNAVFGGLTFTVGMLLLSVASSSSLNVFVLAYTLLGWGGIAVFLASFQFANLYSRPNLWRAIINALFTAAGLVFAVVELLYRAGIRRETVLGVYACVTAVLSIGMLLLYPTTAYQPGDDCSLPVVEWYTGYAPVRAEAKKLIAAAQAQSERQQEKRPQRQQGEEETKQPLSVGHDDEPAEYSTAAAKVEASILADSGSDADDSEKLHATLWQEVRDPQTGLLGLFFAFGLLFSNWYNASIGTQLLAMGDSDGRYAVAFIVVSSLLPIPIAALINHWLRSIQYAGIVAVCCLCVCLSYFPLYVSSLPLQIVGFLLYTLGRAIVITVMFTYAAVHYRPDHYGRIVAVVVAIAIPVGFLQLVMQQLTADYSYTTINTACACGFTPALLYAWWLKQRSL